MGPLGGIVAVSVRRRRLQGAIIAMVLLLATLASTVALNILVGSTSPFETAFEAANGAQLALTFDGATVTPAQVAATGSVAGVTASAGPFAIGQAGFLIDPGDVAKGLPPSYVPGTISARPSPASPVDAITLLDGRWWQAPGEIILSRAEASVAANGGAHVGDTIQLANLGESGSAGPIAHGEVTPMMFRVVGIAASVSTPDVRAWLSPIDVASLTTDVGASTGTAGANAPARPDLQMLYRVVDPSSETSLAAVRTAIAATLPSNAISDATTWLSLQTGADQTANLMVPILLAFAAFAFLAAAFIVINVVSGIVIGNMRQIGLLKAMGATPRQVTVVLLATVLVPASLGAAAGTVIGLVASQPILGSSAAALGVPMLAAASPVVLLGVPLTAIAVTFVAALGPAMSGSRLATTEAITRGSTPSGARRSDGNPRFAPPSWLPDPVRLGLRRLSARPLRTAMTLGALVVGVSALSFTLGMEGSLRQVGQALFREQAAPVRVDIPVGPDKGGDAGPVVGRPAPGGGAPPAPMTPEQVNAAIVGQSAVARSVAIGEADATVAGLANPVPWYAYRGESSWLGYVMTAGRWFQAPGEVVVPDNFLNVTGLHVGDRFTAIVGGHAVPLTIVGSIFDQARCDCTGPRNVVIRGDWATLAAADPALQPSSWEIAPNALLTPAALADQISQATNGYADAGLEDSPDTDEGFLFFEGVIASLGLILVVVALGGVANTVLLETRERLRETAILRAVGMTPRQVVVMVAASVAPLGLVAGVVGVPVGQVLVRAVIGDMGQVALSSSVPPSLTNVLAPLDVLGIVAGGLAIALLGAWLPARRTSSSPIAPVLAAE